MTTAAADAVYYTGPDKAYILVTIAGVFSAFAAGIVLWRISFRLLRRTLDLSDLFIIIALVRRAQYHTRLLRVRH
jgi:hypothetical protein